MKSFFLSNMVCLFIFGCVHPKNEKNITFNMDPLEYKILQDHCEEINSHGDILKLLQEIKIDVQEVLSLMENPGKVTRNQISHLAEEIARKSQKVRSLSKSEWTTQRWDHEIVWRIDDQDFRNNFSLIEANLESIYFMGQERNDLTGKVKIIQERKLALVKYRSLGSSLEICQLQKTLILLMNVYVGNLNYKRHEFFSLNVH